MCAVQLLRASLRQRIVAAAEDFLRRLETEVPLRRLRALLAERLTEEVVALLEETVAEYEGRVDRAERELCRQRRLLDALLKPEVRVRRAETPRIKEEREEPGSSRDGEQLGEEEEEEEEEEQGDIIQFTFKSEDEESSHISQLQSPTPKNREHVKSECGGDECGGSEPASHFHPGVFFPPETETSGSAENDVSGDDWLKVGDEDPASGERCPTLASTTCTECGKTFFSKSSLNLHKKIHSGEKPFSCPFCGVSFTRRSTLVEHVRTHTGERPFICSMCGKTFSQNSNLKIHMKIHTGEKPYSCALCHERFAWNYQLRNHTCDKGEADPDPLLLPDAEDTISEPGTDDSDDWMEPSDPQPGSNCMKNTGVFNSGQKSFTCCECGKAFCSKSGLNRHKKIHAGQKPYGCPWCGATFSRRGTLVDHMRTHTGERPFICAVCGKGFNQNAHLKIHMRLHTGEKTFSCVVCRESFTWSYQLKNHNCAGRTSLFHRIQTDENQGRTVSGCDPITLSRPDGEIDSPEHHTEGVNSAKSAEGGGLKCKNGGKSASCPECGKVFVRKDTLREHMRTHTGEKPFSCSECGKTFNRKTNLTAHMRLHTGEKQFGCPLCLQTFTWHHQLKNHGCAKQRPLLPHSAAGSLGLLT